MSPQAQRSANELMRTDLSGQSPCCHALTGARAGTAAVEQYLSLMSTQNNQISSQALSARESVDFELLYLLEKEPGLSQRELAERLGISLGRVNYCLKALAEKGAVKMRNFRASKTKLRYVYVLTPKGMAERVGLTQRFLARKLEEYERLKAQIEELSEGLPEGQGARQGSVVARR